MNKVAIAEKVKPSICNIFITNGRQVLSAGTGAIVKGDGTIITAKHVVAKDEKPIPGAIVANSLGTIKSQQYQLITPPNLSFGYEDVTSSFRLDIDLAILKPITSIENAPSIALSDKISEVGTDVLIAGYPDDIELPFRFMENLKIKQPDEDIRLKEFYENQFKYHMRQLMFRSGMIGNVQHIHFNNINTSRMNIPNLTTLNIEAAIFWLDKDMTYGGSGGPVVNENGELVGIIVEKAFTESHEAAISAFPSGTGMVLSHKLISWLLPHISGEVVVNLG